MAAQRNYTKPEGILSEQRKELIIALMLTSNMFGREVGIVLSDVLTVVM